MNNGKTAQPSSMAISARFLAWIRMRLRWLIGPARSAAFGALYERHVGRIYTYIYYRTGNQQEPKILPPVRSTRRWIISSATTTEALLFRHGCIVSHTTWLRLASRSRRRKELSLDGQVILAHAPSNPERQAEVSEVREALLSAFKRLPSDRQQLLLLSSPRRCPTHRSVKSWAAAKAQ